MILRRPPHSPLVALLGLFVVAATVSLVFHHALKADPVGWLRWGRELLPGGAAFSTVDYPSWKPLPALLAAPLALLGGAAPAAWLVLMRVGGLVALALVFRLATRLGGRVAGCVAVVALVLTPEWWPTLLGGQIEPTLLALGLLALERHSAGRPRQALVLGAVVALGREEAWPLLLLYAVWVVRTDRALLPVAAGALLAVPALWLGGDWLGSGDPLHGGVMARHAWDAEAQRGVGSVPVYTLGLALSLLAAPLWCAVLAAIFHAGRRESWLVLVLAWSAAAWIGMDIAVAALGLPGEVRFMLPAGGLLSVVAGVGAARAIAAARGRRFVPSPARGAMPAPPSPAAAREPAPQWVPGRAGPPLPC